jgi:crotonobetainyl-CoA:carnitine CoA-transferase CaiB-like acyl-CoA transferase
MMIQAESGLLTGLKGASGNPMFVRSTITDAASGHVLAQAVLAALLNRERHGVADTIHVAIYDVACSLQSNSLTLEVNTGPSSAVPQRNLSARHRAMRPVERGRRSPAADGLA